MKNMLPFLKSTKTKDMIIKMAVLTVLLLLAMFWVGFAGIAAVYLCALICFEFNIKSLYYIVYSFPFQVVWHISHVSSLLFVVYAFFIILHLVRHFVENKKNVFKDKLFLIILIVTFYSLFCPIFLGFDALWGNLSGLSNGRIYCFILCLYIIFLCIKKKDELNIKCLTFFLIASLFVSVHFGMFAHYANINTNFFKFSIGKEYYGLFSAYANANIFHLMITLAILSLFFLYIKKQLNFKILLPLFVFLSVFGFMSTSRAFYLTYGVFVITFLIINMLSKQRTAKERITTSMVLLLAVAVSVLIVFNYVKDGIFSFNSTFYTPSISEWLRDPGRVELFFRYFNDWKSSFLTIVFGRGLGASYHLPSLPPHCLPLYLLWGSGIIGFILISALFIYMFYLCFNKTDRKNNVFISVLFLLVYAISAIFETMVTSIAFPIIVITFLIFISTENKSTKDLNEFPTENEISVT